MPIHASTVYISLSALEFWAFFICIGLLLARAWLLPDPAFEVLAFSRQWRWMLAGCLAVLTFTGLAIFFTRAMEMSGASIAETWPMLTVVLRQTHFGHVWLVHLAALVALWTLWLSGVAMCRSAMKRTVAGFLLVAAVVLALSDSAVSHAADRGDWSLAAFMGGLHLLSATAWGGSILLFALVVFPVWKQQAEPLKSSLAEAVGRLSSLSGVAVAVVWLTGMYNAWYAVGRIDALWTTPYGRTLGVKLILVGAMTLLGAVNRFVLVPRILHRSHLGRVKGGEMMDARLGMVRTVGMEAALVLLILCAAAVLIQAMPPAAMAPHGPMGTMPM